MICIDSDCIIDFLRGKENAKKVLKQYINQTVTTEINAFEVFLGIYTKKEINEQEMRNVRIFFDSVEVLSLNEGDGEVAANILSKLIKKGETINQNDCLIAAIMTSRGYKKIITNNKKHFSKIEDIEVINY